MLFVGRTQVDLLLRGGVSRESQHRPYILYMLVNETLIDNFGRLIYSQLTLNSDNQFSMQNLAAPVDCKNQSILDAQNPKIVQSGVEKMSIQNLRIVSLCIFRSFGNVMVIHNVDILWIQLTFYRCRFMGT